MTDPKNHSKNNQDKSGAPACGMYLRIKSDPDMDLWIKTLKEFSLVIKHRSGYARNMGIVEIELPQDPAQDALEKAAALTHLVQASGLIAIMNGHVSQAIDCGADGVLLADAQQIQAAREKLGEEAIIGLSCAYDEDMAADAITAEQADYITLGLPEKPMEHASLMRLSMLGQGKMLTAALGMFDAKVAGLYVISGVAFIDATYYIMAHKQGAMQATVNFQHEITTALEMAETADKN